METPEEALHRECMEEAGITVEIIQPLGTVIQYRDEIKKKYEVQGFVAELINKSAATTHQEDELGKEIVWMTPLDAKEFFERRVEELKSNPNAGISSDAYQGKLYNTMTALVFLNEAIKYLEE
jgi:8-oxo-dGTP pyrophosphatase MutT (NUDIX family)